MSQHEERPLDAESLQALRAQWQPATGLPEGFAADIARRSRRRRAARAGSVGLLLLAVAATAAVRQGASSPAEPLPSVAVAPTVETRPADEPVRPAFVPEQVTPKDDHADVVADAVALPTERVAASRKDYRASFRAMGDEYDGLAAIYLDDEL